MTMPCVLTAFPRQMSFFFRSFYAIVASLVLACSSAAVLATDFGLAAKAGMNRANTHRQEVYELPAESLWGGVRDGQWPVVLGHLQAGVPVDAPAPITQALSPLLLALKLKKLEIVEKLLAHGADPQQRDGGSDGYSALHYAFWAGIQDSPDRYDTRYMAALLRHGADPHVQTRNTQSLVLLVADHGLKAEPKAMEFLIKEGVDVTRAYLPYCLTALHLAAERPNETSLVRLLLQAGANPNAMAIVDRVTPGTLSSPLVNAWPYEVIPRLLQAPDLDFEQKQLESIDLLLAYGANPRVTLWEVGALPAKMGCGSTGLEGWVKAHSSKGSSARAKNSLDRLLSYSAARPDFFSRLLAATGPIQMEEISYRPVSSLASDLRRVRSSARDWKPSFTDQLAASSSDYVRKMNALVLHEKNLKAGLEKLVATGAPIDPPVRLSAHGFERFWYSSSEGVFEGRVWGAPSLMNYQGLNYGQDDDLFDYWLDLGASPFIYPARETTNSWLYLEVRWGIERRVRKLMAHLDLAYKIPSWCRLSVQELKRGLGDSSPAQRQRIQPVVDETIDRLQKSAACQP